MHALGGANAVSFTTPRGRNGVVIVHNVTYSSAVPAGQISKTNTVGSTKRKLSAAHDHCFNGTRHVGDHQDVAGLRDLRQTVLHYIGKNKMVKLRKQLLRNERKRCRLFLQMQTQIDDR